MMGGENADKPGVHFRTWSGNKGGDALLYIIIEQTGMEYVLDTHSVLSRV